MMDLRILTLLVVIFGVVYSHTTPQNNDIIELIAMITKLQEHVTNLENQQQELKTKVMDSMDNFEVKLMDSMVNQDEKLSNFEGKIQTQQETLTDQYEQIELHLQVDGGTINNNYYGCDNSTAMPPTEDSIIKPQDCTDLFNHGITSDGVYTIYAEDGKPLNVYCEDGGWTVLQRRTDDSIDYAKTLEEYGRGFGSVRGEHWLGLNAMHELTEQGSYTVRFELGDFNGYTAWAEYSNFHVGSATYYTVSFDKDSYRGTAGDSFSYNHGSSFTSMDVDRDGWSGGSCSTDNIPGGTSYGGGGWWFVFCGYTSTTGMDYGTSDSICWYHWKNSCTPLKTVTMKIKRD